MLKKTLIWLLVMAFVLPVSAFAAPPQKVTSLSPNFANNLQYYTLDGLLIEQDALSNLQIQPGSKLTFYLTAATADQDMFLDQEGNRIATADVTMSRLRAGHVDVMLDTPYESYIKSVSLGYHNADTKVPISCPLITIEFTQDIISLEESPFTGSVYIALNNRKQEHSEIAFSGKVVNTPIMVTNSDSIVSLQKGYIIMAQDATTSTILDIGCGVRISIPMYAGQKLYAEASAEILPEDVTLFEQYSKLQATYRLKLLGIHATEKCVTIASDVPLYVYDSQGEYLGTTDELLALSEQYYLSSEQYKELI